MKVAIIFSTLLAVVLAESPAPYPPSGWRPAGQQFTLPSRQSASQEFGPPPPSNQYIPNIAPARNFADSSNFSPNSVNNADREYGVPNTEAPTTEIDFRSSLTPSTYNTPVQTHLSNGNQPQQRPQRVNPNQQFPRQQNNQPFNNQQRQPQNLNNRQNFDLTRNDFGASNQDFVNARRPLNNNQMFNQNLNEDRNRQNFDNDNDDLFDDTDRQTQRQNQDNFLANKGEQMGPENNYGAPTTTRRPTTRGQRRPEKTTPRPITTTEDPETDADSPNIAVSTAIAGGETTGQYFILQPDGRLQKVVYMTAADKTDDKNAAYVANLMYETVEPLKGPIYSYNTENQLVRIN